MRLGNNAGIISDIGATVFLSPVTLAGTALKPLIDRIRSKAMSQRLSPHNVCKKFVKSKAEAFQYEISKWYQIVNMRFRKRLGTSNKQASGRCTLYFS